MNYDCMIIGGGLAGLSCGLCCANEGLKTIIIADGMNALHFSSGSFDVIGYDAKRKLVAEPFAYLKKLIKEQKEHPYAKIGLKSIREAITFFCDQLNAEQMRLYCNGEQNHFHITILGTQKPTYLSQESVFNERLKEAFDRRASIAVLNFEGYRDYFAKLTVEQLKGLSLMKGIPIRYGLIKLPYYTKTEKNLNEFRSIDLARVFDSERFLPRIADEIKKSAGDAEIVSLPAFIGINNFKTIHRKLEELTGKLIYEAPGLPPSILGMRIDNALKTRFASLQGIFSIGDKVMKGTINNGTVEYIVTQNNGETPFTARYFVLATGSFFSGGLKSEFNHLEEPIFKLKLYGNQNRSTWYSKKFFDKASHPFLEYGVVTNNNLQPYGEDGKIIKNLFCAGSILSHYNPIKEGSGGGVAIGSGYVAAKRIIQEIKKRR